MRENTHMQSIGTDPITAPSLISRLSAYPGVAVAVSLLAGAAYLIQSFYYAHNQESILDEGAYLLKGVLFITGKYVPFQNYGPWTNQMPLSFLIPGLVEVIFGPGLRTGRYFAILLGLLMMIGLWIVANRLGGKWWAAAAIWVIALNPAMIKTYSIAASQVLIACMLMWTLVLILGEERQPWQLALGSFLAAAMVLTRMNMLPVVVLVVLYIFWQHGWRAGVISAAVAGATLIIGHGLFWPNIMRLWASWIPGRISPFLNSFRLRNSGIGVWSPSISSEDRWLSFWLGFRANFIPMMAMLTFSIPVLFSSKWRSTAARRMALFLILLFSSLWLAHAWASLTKSYCVYCYTSYLTFFGPTSLLLIILVNRNWMSDSAKWFSWVSGFIVVMITTSIGFSSSRVIGPNLAGIQIPRLKNLRLQTGGISVWGMLKNRFGLEQDITQVWLAVIAGLFIGLVLIVASAIIYRRMKDHPGSRPGYGLILINSLLALGLVLSPTIVLGNQVVQDCPGDVISSVENVGAYLNKVIPPGSNIYWKGSLSTAPLLYVDGLELYPPQINQTYSLRSGGDAEELLKFGLWNEKLSDQWANEADFVIIEERRYDSNWKERVESGEFEELPRSETTTPCKDKYRLRIFRRNVE